jgi:hypothetical protein
MNGTDGITFIFARNLVDAINKVGEGHALFASRFYLINEYLTFYEEDLLKGDFSDKDYLEKRGRTASFHFLLGALDLGDEEKERLFFDSVVFEDKERKFVSIWYYDKDFSYPHICVFSSSSFIYTLDLVVRDIFSLNSISQGFKSRVLDYMLGFKESIKGGIVSFSSVASSSDGYERSSKRQYEYLSDVFLNKLKNIFDLLLTGSPEKVSSLVDDLLEHNISFYENIVGSLRVASDKQTAYDYKEEPVFYFRRVEEPSYQDKSPLFLESYYMEGGKVHLWAVPTYGELTPKELREGYFYLSLDIEKLPFSGKFVIIPLHLSTEDGNFVLLFPFKVMRIGDNLGNLGEAYEFGSCIPLNDEIKRKIGHLGRYIKTSSFRRPKISEEKGKGGRLSLFLDYLVQVFLHYDFTEDLRNEGFYDISSNLYINIKDLVIDAKVGESWYEVYIIDFRSREGKCLVSLPKFVVNGKRSFCSIPIGIPDEEKAKFLLEVARGYLKECLDVFEEDFMKRRGLEPALIVRSVYDGGLGLILGDQGFSNEKRWDMMYVLDLSYFSVGSLIDSIRFILEDRDTFYKCLDKDRSYFSFSRVSLSLNSDSDISVTTDFSYLIKAIEEPKNIDKKVFDLDTNLCFDNGESRLNIPIYSLSESFRERFLRNLLQSNFEINKMKILFPLGLLGEDVVEEDQAKLAIVSLFLSGIPSDQRLFDALISTNLGGIVGILDYFGKILDFKSIEKGVEFNISAKYTLFLDIRRKIDEGKENSTVSTVIVEFRPFSIDDNDKILPMIVNSIEVREGEFITVAYLSSLQELVEKPTSRF